MTKEDLDSDKVLVIHDFLSGEECAALIQRSEGFVYEPGTVADVVIDEVRNNERVLLDDPVLAADLFDRSKSFLPAVLGECPPIFAAVGLCVSAKTLTRSQISDLKSQ